MKYILIILTLACSFNTQAELNIKDNLRNAERSPLFQQKFPSAQISSKGLDIIKLHNGAEMQFHKYTQLTRLDENEKFKPLMKPSTVNQYLQSKPSYSENILQLEDRMIVERNMKVSMKKGVCKQRNLPVSVNELCFVNNNKQIPQETQAYIQSIRKKLKNANDNEQVKNGVTAKQMRNMNDEQLLDVLLNSDDREITMVSVLPTEVYNSPTKSNLWNTSKKLKASDFNNKINISSPNNKMTFVSKKFQKSPSQSSNSNSNRQHQVFPKKYFLTGFTLGREITDSYEIHIANSTWLTDRYYLKFEYEFKAGFGLRFPFSVSVESQATHSFEQPQAPEFDRVQQRPKASRQGKPEKGNPRKGKPTKSTQRKNTVVRATRPSGNKKTPTRSTNTRNIRDQRKTAVNQPDRAAGENISTSTVTPITHADLKISVAPVDVDSNGLPAYPAVNLPQGKYFDGKEFVLEFHASCNFYASIPGPNIDKDCPTVDFSKSRHINPVIGSDRTNLGTLWVNGDVTRLNVSVGAGKARLDFGLQANITNGRIKFNTSGYNNTVIEGDLNHPFVFNNKNIQQVKAFNKSNKNIAFSIEKPSYGFELELLPVARVKLNVDLGIKSFNKTLGPYSLDALSLTVGHFALGHHEGTVTHHNIVL